MCDGKDSSSLTRYSRMQLYNGQTVVNIVQRSELLLLYANVDLKLRNK